MIKKIKLTNQKLKVEILKENKNINDVVYFVNGNITNRSIANNHKSIQFYNNILLEKVKKVIKQWNNNTFYNTISTSWEDKILLNLKEVKEVIKLTNSKSELTISQAKIKDYLKDINYNFKKNKLTQ